MSAARKVGLFFLLGVFQEGSKWEGKGRRPRILLPAVAQALYNKPFAIDKDWLRGGRTWQNLLFHISL